MKLQAYIQVTDPDTGKTIIRKRKCNSFVFGLMTLLMTAINQSSTVATYSDTSSAAHTVAVISTSKGGAGVTAYGIVVGTGSGAVAVTDNKLGTLIANGVGAGQLQYGAETLSDPVTAGGTTSFTLVRNVANGSGGDITVNEVGHYWADAGAIKWMFDRTLSTFIVPNGGNRTITYTISVTV